jgi:hypothetical protein
MADYSKKIGVIPVESDGGAAVEAQIAEADIFVTGPMSSGTRLVCQILEAGGFSVVHDSLHGIVNRPTAKVVIAVTREPSATHRSVERAFKPDERISTQDSIKGIAEFYPNALWISYDQLCVAPDATILVLAEWLAVDPWSMPVEIIRSQNSIPGGSKMYKEIARNVA